MKKFFNLGLPAASLFAVNTLFCCLLLYPFALIRLLIPVPTLRRWCTDVMIHIGEFWISGNDLNMRLTQSIKWDVQGLEGLSYEKSYLISANHQSWMDIVILQHIFNRKIPFIRFFLKHELIYVPLLGWAWWALDFPFMKRHSKKFLERYPEKRNEDFESIQKACAKFKGRSVSVLNFLEGTRFTKEKHSNQNSNFENLLMPKAGGLAFVLNVMGEQFDSLLDVTIYYPYGVVNMWQTFCGKLPEVVVRVTRVQIPSALLKGDYLNDPTYRGFVQDWSQDLWKTKDTLLAHLKK